MSDEWYSPKIIFDKLGIEFDLDPSHPNHKTDVPCKKYFTKEDDGLTQKWDGVVWMNPPYSKPAPWVERWLTHQNGLALLPLAKSKWFNHLMDSDAKFVLLPSTFKFNSPENKSISLMMASSIWAIGDYAIEKLIDSDLGKVR
jgi:phage N-6-adenine-methyltransferase